MSWIECVRAGCNKSQRRSSANLEHLPCETLSGVLLRDAVRSPATTPAGSAAQLYGLVLGLKCIGDAPGL